MLTMVCSGCAEVATNVVLQGGIQYAGETLLIANNKPITRCSIYNVTRGYKMCRVSKVYAKNTSNS